MSDVESELSEKYELMREVLVLQWQEDLLPTCLALVESSKISGTWVAALWVWIRKSLVQQILLLVIEQEREQYDSLIVHALSLRWMESYYFSRLWTTRLFRWATRSILPERICQLFFPNEVNTSFARDYLRDYIEGSTLWGVCEATFLRYTIPSIASLAFASMTSLLQQELHIKGALHNCFASLVIRPLGAGLGHWLYPRDGIGAFWGGMLSYGIWATWVRQKLLFAAFLKASADEPDAELPEEEESMGYQPHGTDESNFYSSLGVSPDSDTEEIEKAYKKLVMQYHPDRHANSSKEEQQANEEKMKELTRAWPTLKDERKRRAYDAWLEDKKREQETKEWADQHTDNTSRVAVASAIWTATASMTLYTWSWDTFQALSKGSVLDYL